MTTKFSKNRARVQPTPKVCKSTKKEPPAPPPDPYPATINLICSWNLQTSGFPLQTSSKTAGGTLTKTSGGNYTQSGTDNQGRSYTLTADITLGAPSSMTLAIAGFGSAGNDATASGPAWTNTIHPQSITENWTIAPGIFGSISAIISVP